MIEHSFVQMATRATKDSPIEVRYSFATQAIIVSNNSFLMFLTPDDAHRVGAEITALANTHFPLPVEPLSE